jgi:hypothetical protein
MTIESADNLTVEQALELVRLGCVIEADDGKLKPITEYPGRYDRAAIPAATSLARSQTLSDHSSLNRQQHCWRPQLRLAAGRSCWHVAAFR